MRDFLLTQLELMLRIVIAGVCGALIGYERKNRLKEAGIRTHMIVALGSALIMIVSKYGFADVLLLKGYALDPSRIAAQIVSGIGFLGAGVIFVRHQSISGLTTAAGIWVTAGVGMAIGSQLYAVGIAAAAMVLLVQMLWRKEYIWFHLPQAEPVHIVFDEDTDAITYMQETLSSSGIEIVSLKVVKSGNGVLNVELYIKLPKKYDAGYLMDLFKNNPHIKSIEY